jgi:hypothetical protein
VLEKGVLSLGWNRGMKSSVFMQECGTLLPLYPTICQGALADVTNSIKIGNTKRSGSAHCTSAENWAK